MTINASEINKLRQQTGVGMMECKKALIESNGDFEIAIKNLRKRGQKLLNDRYEKESNEGVTLSMISNDGKRGAIILLSCETDFVSKNIEFIKSAEEFLYIALDKNISSIDDLRLITKDKIFELVSKIGEKIDITKYEFVTSESIFIYNHPGYKLSSVVGFNLYIEDSVGKDIAMQVAAMNPISIDKNDIDPKLIEIEIEISKEQSRREGKSDDLLDKIAQGKLNKFYTERTLMNQSFIKDDKKTIRQFINDVSEDIEITLFKRIQI